MKDTKTACKKKIILLLLVMPLATTAACALEDDSLRAKQQKLRMELTELLQKQNKGLCEANGQWLKGVRTIGISVVMPEQKDTQLTEARILSELELKLHKLGIATTDHTDAHRRLLPELSIMVSAPEFGPLTDWEVDAECTDVAISPRNAALARVQVWHYRDSGPDAIDDAHNAVTRSVADAESAFRDFYLTGNPDQ